MKRAHRMSISVKGAVNGNKSGKESMHMLRQRFEAETDVEIDPCPSDWKQYAEWLEKLSIGKINNELVRENEMLRSRMQEAFAALDAGISGRASAFRKRGPCRESRHHSSIKK